MANSSDKADTSAQQSSRETNYMGRGVASGLCFGVALGLVFGVALDNMAFMSIGIGAGMAIGVAIGASMQQRNQESADND